MEESLRRNNQKNRIVEWQQSCNSPAETPASPGISSSRGRPARRAIAPWRSNETSFSDLQCHSSLAGTGAAWEGAGVPLAAPLSAPCKLVSRRPGSARLPHPSPRAGNPGRVLAARSRGRPQRRHGPARPRGGAAAAEAGKAHDGLSGLLAHLRTALAQRADLVGLAAVALRASLASSADPNPRPTSWSRCALHPQPASIILRTTQTLRIILRPRPCVCAPGFCPLPPPLRPRLSVGRSLALLPRSH